MSKKKELLFKLVKEHPEWPSWKLAELTGYSRDGVRGALSNMGIRLRERRTSKLMVTKEERSQDPAPSKTKPKPDPRKHMFASKANSNRSGYTKLL